MVKYLRSLDGTGFPCLTQIPVAASQTIVKGDLLVISSGKVAKAGAAATGIIGIANGPITTGDSPTDVEAVEVVLINRNSVLEFSFLVSGTKKSFTSADCFGTAFDMSAAQAIDPDDTTGGVFRPIKAATQASAVVQGCISAAKLWNA